MLDLAILGLLKERAMHGYELKRQLGQRLGFFWTVSFGSLYPTLKKLETSGCVERVPDTDGRSRRRQVYRITDPGEKQFLELIGQGSSSAWEEEKFPLRFAFFRYLPTETRVWLLQRRQDYLEDRLQEGRAALARARHGRADPYTVSLMRHGLEQTEHDLTWINELLLAEGGPDGPHGPGPVDPDRNPPPTASPDAHHAATDAVGDSPTHRGDVVGHDAADRRPLGHATTPEPLATLIPIDRPAARVPAPDPLARVPAPDPFARVPARPKENTR